MLPAARSEDEAIPNSSGSLDGGLDTGAGSILVAPLLDT